MKTIYKYELDPDEPTTLLPETGEVLSAGVQGSSIFIWVLCNPDEPKRTRHFEVYGTGWTIPNTKELSFISTVFMDSLVFHVFEDLQSR